MVDQHLTVDDVQKLLNDPSPDHRADAAAKVSAQFGSGELSEDERAIAEDIFRAMVKDVEVRVRKALSESLADSPDVPHDVALNLAQDVEEVALPVIQNSIVLTDEDLIEIVETKGSEIQRAVAGRKHVSGDLATALADTHDEGVIETLVSNEGAEISESTMDKVLDEFGDKENINVPMAQRGMLPLKVAERLVALVSEKMRDHLVTHHELAPDTATDLILSARERATVSFLEPGGQSPDVLDLVEQLHKNGRLTPTIILRALCMGDASFFEAALARKADISAANAYQLVHDRGSLGLENLFKTCDMPEAMLPVARAALAVVDEMVVSGGDDWNLFRELMIERVLTSCEEEFDGEHLDYFIGKLGKAKRAAA